MEENIVISPNPVISPANHTIGQQNEGWWNGNFLPNTHLAKFLDGLMTAQEVAKAIEKIKDKKDAYIDEQQQEQNIDLLNVETGNNDNLL